MITDKKKMEEIDLTDWFQTKIFLLFTIHLESSNKFVSTRNDDTTKKTKKYNIILSIFLLLYSHY